MFTIVPASRRIRTVYWNNIPSPYVIGRFNAVAKRDNIFFEAWFNEERESDRSWDIVPSSWHFPARYIPSVTVRGRKFQIPEAELEEYRPDVLIALTGTPSFMAGTAVSKRLSSRTSLRVLPTFDTWVARSHTKEIAKHWLFRGIDSVKVPGQSGRELATKYGTPASRIVHVTQSVDIEHFAAARKVPADVRRQERERRELSGCVFLYVGRLWAGKGLDTLFDSYEQIAKITGEVSLLIVGDGEDEAKYRERARTLPRVRFEGFVQPVDLPEIYGLADVFVFPTLGDPHGLVVEEAMAAGLPVICTKAAGDIDARLPHGSAGFVVPPSDSNALLARMIQLAGDLDMRKRMSQVATHSVVNRNHEAYARDFEAFIERTMLMAPVNNCAARLLRNSGIAISRALPTRTPAPYVSGSVRKV